MGEDHTSVKTNSKGLVEVILELEKENVWLLLIKQSEHDIIFEEIWETGSENLEIVLFKIEIEGWPNECQEDIVAFGEWVANIAVGASFTVGHS